VMLPGTDGCRDRLWCNGVHDLKQPL